MDAKALIDSYTNDVARRLPRKLRNEVGLELRALLSDELEAAAQGAGRAPDRDMTIEVLRNFGRPEVVAARYAPPPGFNVIEPEHAPAFIKLALLCVGVQWAFTLTHVFSSSATFGEWWLDSGLGAFQWVGLLVVWFAFAGWIQRRSPVDPHSFTRPWTHYIFFVPVADWQPGQPDADQLLYARAKTLVPLSALAMLVLISPARLLSALLPEGVDTSWARYDADFAHWLLGPLVALMVVRIALFTLAAINERWRARTEPVRFGLWVAFIGALIWSTIRWDIFASGVTDFFFKAWLSIFILVNCLQIWGWIRRALTRVRLPRDLSRDGRTTS